MGVCKRNVILLFGGVESFTRCGCDDPGLISGLEKTGLGDVLVLTRIHFIFIYFGIVQ